MQLFLDDHAVHRRQAGAAEALGHVPAEEPQLVGRGDDVGRMRGVLVVLGRLRPDLLRREVVRQLPQGSLLVGERERRTGFNTGAAGRRELVDHGSSVAFGATGHAGRLEEMVSNC